MARFPLKMLLICLCALALLPARAWAEEDDFFYLIAPTQAPALEEAPEGAALGEPALPEAQLDRQVFVITLGGNVALGTPASLRGDLDSFDGYAADMLPGYFFEGLSSVFDLDHLTLVNLEGPLTDAEGGTKQQQSFKGSPDYARILTEGGIEMVCLANNRILDYGQQGLEDTKRALSGQGIAYAAAGESGLYEKDGVRVGVIANTFPYDSRGKDISADVQALREAGCHIVIASFHWGSENAYAFTAQQRSLGRAAIDAGADVVMGHHPRVVQGIERYNGRYILYSLGNLIYSGTGNTGSADGDSYLAQLTFILEGGAALPPELTIIPVSLTGTDGEHAFHPSLPEEIQAETIIRKIEALGDGL